MVERVRKKTDVPLAFMTYINPIYAYGIEKWNKTILQPVWCWANIINCINF